MPTPEDLAREKIDQLLTAAGWSVQDYRAFNPSASRGIALREVPLASGRCDYLLLVDRVPVGVIEAKKEGTTLSTVADQSGHYAENLPDFLAALLPKNASVLPFAYESTGVETLFRDQRDPDARSRRVFAFHQPETMADWLAKPDTLRARLRKIPPLADVGSDGAKNGTSTTLATMRACQVEAITSLEKSFATDLPRALIQMATGSGKTYTACAFTYRLIRHCDAKRVLFLVDRANLGRQAKSEFDQFVTPDTGRKFTELYNVQHLTSNQLDTVARVTICTIQRLYSILRGEAEFDEDLDEKSAAELSAAYGSGSGSGSGSGVPPLGFDPKRQDAASTAKRCGTSTFHPLEVAYNAKVPIEAFDFIVTDECHRSIYGLWRQVLEYFDAHLIGLTATPSKQTVGFFNQNLVMEYNHERAVADGVNVGYEVYRIKTQVTAQGGVIDKGFYVDRRSKETRARRLELLDEDLPFAASDLDRSIVVESQIRTVLTAFRDALFTDLFPGRTLVPKTLIFAKDDSHAEDIVHLVRQVFGKGNDFAKKITYKSAEWKRRPGALSDSSGGTPLPRRQTGENLIAEFRTSPSLRVAVTVDMIATGTDIKPLECLLFLRDVRSRTYFEQMKGRGTRVLTPTDLQAVSGADARAKTHFVIVDAVGVCESDKTESRPLERQPSVNFPNLLLGVALGKRDEDTLTTLAGRLARLDRELTAPQRQELATIANGKTISQIAASLLRAVDPDEVEAASRRLSVVAEDLRAAELATYFNPLAPVEITEANLPHWQQIGATYFVTFRLADALPAEQLAIWQAEREAWLQRRSGVPPLGIGSKRQDAASTLLSAEDQAEYHRLFSGRIENWLDQGHGSLVLSLPECRQIVENALRHFDGDRYQLGEFVVAANHVHVLVTPTPNHDLSAILHSWKSFTAKEIIKVEAASRRLSNFWDDLHSRRLEDLKRQDAASTIYPATVRVRPVWQKESYDHIVRSPAALAKIEEYIRSHSAWENKRQDAASTLLEHARKQLITDACAPFDNPALRDALAKAKQDAEQTIDTVTIDKLEFSGFDAAAKARAQSLVQSFRDYVEQHRAEIGALQILYSRPYRQRLTEPMLKELEKRLSDAHATWTEDTLWRAFAATAPERVKGRSQAGRFADLVALVRFSLQQQPILEPFADSVRQRFDAWLKSRSAVPALDALNKRQDAASTFANQSRSAVPALSYPFTPEQLQWLELIRDHIATTCSIEADDFEFAPFSQRGGLGKAHQLFGDQLPKLLNELNEVLAA